MESMSKVKPLLERYEGNRVIRGLIQLVPFGIGSAVDVVLVKTLEKMQENRARSYFDALVKGGAYSGDSCHPFHVKAATVVAGRPIT